MLEHSRSITVGIKLLKFPNYDNLESAEKFVFGGANGVRAYPACEGSGDTGWIGILELRCAIMPQVTASIFTMQVVILKKMQINI